MTQDEPVIECVVNINHSQENDFISRLVSRIDVYGTKVAHIDRGSDAQRTVLTIISPVKEMGLILYNIYELCSQEQDIKTYSGNHPSAGIVDVVPFIPIRDIDKESLMASVDEWALQISSSFGVPIIYYGAIASEPMQKHLSDIRRGGPDVADQRLRAGELMPAYGPNNSHDRLGVSSWTIRDYMVAYNVSLKTRELKVAKDIAKEIRKLRVREGRLQDVRVLGWLTEEYDCVQISANLYDLYKMTMKDFYDLVSKISHQYGTEVVGSELIGMTLFRGLSKDCSRENVDMVIDTLGLSYHGPFIKEKRILEYII